MTTNTDLTFVHGYNIRSYEPRADGHIGINTICNQLQDIASRHADTLGFGFHDLEKSGHFWLLARLHVVVDRLPCFGDSVEVHTWPSGNERLVALRDFLISDDTGLIGRATTSWVTMNTQSHRPDPPDTVLNRRFIPERDRAVEFPSKAIKRLKEGEHTAAITARRADLDINGHVNNVHYTEFCMEAVPHEFIEAHACVGIDIQFRSESFAGDNYTAACTCIENENGRQSMLHSLTRMTDGKEIVRMQTWWIEK